MSDRVRAMQQSLHHNTQQNLRHRRGNSNASNGSVAAKPPARAEKTARNKDQEAHLRTVIKEIEIEMQHLVDLLVDSTR